MIRIYLVIALFCTVIFAGLVALGGELGVRRDGDTLAVVTTRQGAIGIFVLDLPTGILHRLTPPEIAAVNPVWSPDGEQILFTTVWDNSQQYLMVMDADGGNLTEVQQFGRAFQSFGQSAWTADGDAIVFIVMQNNRQRIFSIDPSGTGEPQPIEDDSEDAQDFLTRLNRTTQGQFSTNDGQRTVSVAQVAGRWALILIDLQSEVSEPQVLAYLATNAVTAGVLMAISADGEQVVYRNVAEGGGLNLFVADIDAVLAGRATPRQITYHGESSPSWRPSSQIKSAGKHSSAFLIRCLGLMDRARVTV